MKSNSTACLLATAFIALAGVAHAQGAGTGKPLDRDGLIKLANDYFAALLAHDPRKVPLASDVKTVENAKRIQAGEGLWKSTSAAPTEFKIVVPDTMSQQVGGMMMIQTEGKSGAGGLSIESRERQDRRGRAHDRDASRTDAR